MDTSQHLIVTTSRNNRRELHPQAMAVAQRCGLPFVERRSGLTTLLADTNAWGAYVVSRPRHAIETHEHTLTINPGLFFLKRVDGLRHPLIRAIAPPDGEPVHTILDATLGIASDAVHVAYAIGATVDGLEASSVLACLLREGLRKMSLDNRAWSDAAARVHVSCTHALPHLKTLPSNSVPVIFFDPMFNSPRLATPGFSIVRRLALHEPLSLALLTEACRVASRRVVLKLPGGAEPPSIVPPETGWNRRVRGRAIDLIVAEFELKNPTYEPPYHGFSTTRATKPITS